MSNPLTKSNEGFRPNDGGQIHRVTVEFQMPGNPGEIAVLLRAAVSLESLAKHGTMPTHTRTITREVLDSDE